MSNRPYKKVLFAYIDLLGFANRVKQSTTADEVWQMIERAEHGSALGEFKSLGIRRLVISDSIILIAPPEAIFPLLVFCIHLQSHLVSHGILIRGAISYEDHYEGTVNRSHKYLDGSEEKNSTELTISKALIASYHAESQLSEPIIHILDSVTPLLNDINCEFKPIFENKKIYLTKFNHQGHKLDGNLSTLFVDEVLSDKINQNSENSEIAQREANFSGAIFELMSIRDGIISGYRSAPKKAKKYWVYVAKKFNYLIEDLDQRVHEEYQPYKKDLNKLRIPKFNWHSKLLWRLDHPQSVLKPIYDKTKYQKRFEISDKTK